MKQLSIMMMIETLKFTKLMCCGTTFLEWKCQAYKKVQRDAFFNQGCFEYQCLRRVPIFTSLKQFNCPESKFSVRRYIIKYHDLSVESWSWWNMCKVSAKDDEQGWTAMINRDNKTGSWNDKLEVEVWCYLK